MTEHRYEPSGWCSCGHHRDDGTRDRPAAETIPTRTEIRTILNDLGPTYQPKGQP